MYLSATISKPTIHQQCLSFSSHGVAIYHHSMKPDYNSCMQRYPQTHTQNRRTCCRVKNQNKDGRLSSQEVDLSVLRFTLGIPGFDESNLPRIIGIIVGFLLCLNHFLSHNSVTPAQLRSEFVGVFLSMVSVSLPYIGQFLPGMSVAQNQVLPKGRKVFLMAENLSDEDREDIAWGTYALLRNTSSTSVVVFHSEVSCARGFWNLHTSSNDDTLRILNHEITQLILPNLKNTLYIASDADKQGWDIIPEGVASLLLQPFDSETESRKEFLSQGFILLLSNMNRAYGEKDRAWIAALAKKFKTMNCSGSN